MTGLLRADIRKLLHRWMPRILLLILVAIVALIFLGIASSRRSSMHADLVPPDGLVVALSLGAGFAAFIWPVLAGSWAGGEYGWGTIRMSLTRQPRRAEFSLSGLIVVLLTVGFGLILVMLTGVIAGSIVGAATHSSAASAPAGVSPAVVIVKTFFGAWYASAFYAVLAYTCGAVFRSAPAGIGVGIGFAVAQSAVSAIFSALGDPWKSVAQHLPDAYTTALTSRLSHELITSGPLGDVPASAASIQASILGLAIYLIVLLAIMLVAVERRDVTA